MLVRDDRMDVLVIAQDFTIKPESFNLRAVNGRGLILRAMAKMSML